MSATATETSSTARGLMRGRVAVVTDAAAIASAAERIAAELGTVDLLVNNAGVMLPGDIGEQPASEWQQMIDTNLTGARQRLDARHRADAASVSGGVLGLGPHSTQTQH
jgi:NADP-dependent 3-hydroxy acid dehydrogenase YdfG